MHWYQFTLVGDPAESSFIQINNELVDDRRLIELYDSTGTTLIDLTFPSSQDGKPLRLQRRRRRLFAQNYR